MSNKHNINQYSIDQLDKFVEKTLFLLNFDENEIERIKENKIHYFLCNDESEIKLLTGYAARGIYYLASDYIISTFTCHYHELCHLLINYKFKNLDLYTLPFFQEGFAVAYGGRGGKEPAVILEMAKVLFQSEFIDYKMLLNRDGFVQFDASMSYPAAGLYTKFIIENNGIDHFLDLYRKYSTSEKEISQIKINEKDLPSDAEWKEYLDNFYQQQIGISDINEKEFTDTIISGKDFTIYSNSTTYLFEINGAIALIPQKTNDGYKRSLFAELFPKSSYQNEKYIISANANEVSIYNLYTNNLIAKYVTGFSINGQPVEQQNGKFLFSAPKSVFDKTLENFTIKKID